MANIQKKKKTSIRTRILIPVLILGLIALFTSIASAVGIGKVNDSATQISDVYLASSEELSGIQRDIQDLHKYALSHIIATDFDTMIQIVGNVSELEEKLDQKLADYDTYVSKSTRDDYENLLSDYDGLKDTIKVVMAYSANSQTVDAYGTANGQLADYGTALETDISAINDENAKATDAEQKTLARVYYMFMALSICTVLLSVLSILFTIIIVSRQVIAPIQKAEKELNSIIRDIDNRQGDLTRRIPVKYNDEVGALSSGINSFMEKLQHIFLIISNNSEKMDTVVSDVLSSVRTSNDSASDLSALTEELLATMQEVANNAQAINGNADAIRVDVNEIANKTSEITTYSRDMKSNADQMELDARNNVEVIGEKVNSILEVLDQAIDDSKSVEQVNSLTNEILSIASQTNLLALNASIEAARAGDAGRGFAVVADEISNLADNSRTTANNIQQINAVVITAVHNLAENSENLVQFMKESILPEFENFVESGAQYKEDATYIEGVMNDFSEKTSRLNDVMTEIAESISTISSAIDEGVNGVNGAADSTQVLVTDMDDISRRMNENSEIAGDLRQETSIFARL